MNRFTALTTRELRSYFLAPVGYIVIALFALLTGLIFVFFAFDQGQPASMRSVFAWGTWLLLFLCPAISMRAIAEERRMGTYEMLMTSPVTERQVILSKFLAAWVFLLVMFIPTLANVLALESYGSPDYGELACGYLGMSLAGAAYLATGIFASSLTASQVVAFLLPLFFWLFINIACKLLPAYVSFSDTWASVLYACDSDQRLREFTVGLFDTSNVVFFASVTALFLTAAVVSLQVRRWA